MYKMKLSIFRILIIVLIVLVMLSAITVSCANYQPYNANEAFASNSKFEGFKNNSNMLDYSDKDKNKALDSNKQYLIDGHGASCKTIFGFNGLFCAPADVESSVDKIGSAKGSAQCLGQSSGLTNSKGGLCLDSEQKKLLSTRGGNMSTGEHAIGM
jgi:Tfp pilus assembly protein PilV